MNDAFLYFCYTYKSTYNNIRHFLLSFLSNAHTTATWSNTLFLCCIVRKRSEDDKKDSFHKKMKNRSLIMLKIKK